MVYYVTNDILDWYKGKAKAMTSCDFEKDKAYIFASHLNKHIGHCVVINQAPVCIRAKRAFDITDNHKDPFTRDVWAIREAIGEHQYISNFSPDANLVVTNRDIILALNSDKPKSEHLIVLKNQIHNCKINIIYCNKYASEVCDITTYINVVELCILNSINNNRKVNLLDADASIQN